MRRALSLILITITALLTLSATWAQAVSFTVVPSSGNYKNVVKVTKTGAGLRSIQAALDSISDAAEDNRYLVEVGPGVFEEQVTMKSWVDIRGIGIQATVISYPGGDDGGAGTVLGADNCVLSNLTVLNTGGSAEAYAIAVNNYSVSPTLNRIEVRVEADGANAAYGVLNDYSASPLMSDLSVEVSGAGSVGYGIYNIGAYCAPTILRARAEVEGGAYAYAVYNETEAAPQVKGLICRATGASSSNVALYNKSDAAPVMDDVRAIVDGDTGAGYALYCNDAQVVVRGLVIEATGGGSSRAGLYVMDDASTVNLSNLTAVVTNSSGPAHGAYIRNSSSVTVDHFHLEVQGSVTSSNGFNCGGNTLDLRHGSILVTGGSSITSHGILLDGTGTLTASDVTCDVPATTGTEYGIYAAYASDSTLNNCNIQSGDDGIYSGLSNSTTMELSNCRISGGTYAIHNLSNGTVSVGSSMLADTVSNAGTLNCYQCFTSTMSSACP